MQTINRYRHLESSREELLEMSPLERFTKTEWLLDVVLKSFVLFPNSSLEDIKSAGRTRLWQCCNRIEESARVNFYGFSYLTVRLAMIDEIRSLDDIPRNVRKMMKRLNIASQEIETELRREPTIQEALTRAFPDPDERDTVERVKWWFEHGKVSIDATMELQDSTEQPHTALLKQETFTTLLQCVDMLPLKERTMVNLYYFDDKGLREIGEMFGYTAARISQILHEMRVKLARLFSERCAS